MTSHSLAKAKRRRFTPIALTTGVVAAALLSVSMTGTLSGFVASINNSTNTTATGALIMQEQNAAGTVTCLSTDGGTLSTNTATCATINKLGGSTTMVPGQTITTNITIKNTGTVNAGSFTLTPSACTQSAAATPSGTATDLCTQLQLVIMQGSTQVYSGTAAGLGTAVRTIAGPPAAGASLPFSFAATLPAAAGNTYQCAVPLLWCLIVGLPPDGPDETARAVRKDARPRALAARTAS